MAFFLLVCQGSASVFSQITERPRPKEWDNLVEGTRFIDRFLPMPEGKLSANVWGGENVVPRFVDNGIEDDIRSYWGGNITSGLQMRLKALHAFTARLPLIDSEGDVPEIGYNTETAIRAGVIQGIKFEIEGYIKHFKEKYPDLLVFLTGGDNFNFDSTIKSIIFADKFIVPRGLNRILIFNNDTLQNNS